MMGKTPIDDHQVVVQGGLYHMKCSRASKMIIVMAKEHDNLRALGKKVASNALAHIKEGKHLERLLEETLISIKYLKEEVLSLKDEVVASSDRYFKREKKHVAFFYMNLDLSRIYLFKMVRDNQMVDDE